MNVHLPALPPNIEDIVAGHDKALELYRAAFGKIEEAHEAIEAAFSAVAEVTPGAEFHSGIDSNEVNQFHKAVVLPKREDYMATAAKILTLRCWHYVVDKCGLQQLMDKQAKEELDASLRYVSDKPRHRREVIDDEEIAKGPAPFTVENVMATFRTFAGQADMIWQRGIANAFSGLDRRFRSHDGFKVGSRIILNRMVTSSWSGRIDTYGEQAERFRDIERAFRILDGVDPKDAQSTFLHTVNQGRSDRGAHQSEHVHDYFKVRIFQNGNAHLWFTRKDLVEKVNKVLAHYYGEVIGDANQAEEDIFENRALTPARAFGFFPTNAKLAEKIVKLCRYQNGGKPMRILEPSAGSGNLAFAIAEPFKWHGRYDEPEKTLRHIVDAVEIQPTLAKILRANPMLNSVTTTDFLQMKPTPHKLYDGILMNPPFDRERDIDHVTHAMKFLKPDGWLVSIMSAGVEFRETRKAGAFRKLISDKKGWIVDLPAGSFADVGTNVNTVLVGWGISEPSTYHW